MWAAGVGAVLAFGLSWRADRFDPGGLTDPFPPAGDLLLAPAARWDAVWFLLIAEEGYGGERAAFFPLYPGLVRLAGSLAGSDLVGAVAVSGLSLLAALVLLHRLVALDFGPRVAGLTVSLVALFPTAFFFSAAYSEALFLALSVGAVLAARTDRWALAGVAGAFAATTRSAGIVLVVPLVLLYVRRHGWRRPGARALWIGAVPLGTAAFGVLLAVAGQDPLSPLQAQEAWRRTFAGPLGAVPDGAVAAWHGARQLLSGSREPVLFTASGGDPFEVARNTLTDLAFLAGALVAMAGAIRRLPAAYSAYAGAALLLPLSNPVAAQPLMSLPRFVAVLWPLHLWAALVTVDRPRARRALLAASVVLLIVHTALFSTWEWVA